MSPRPPRADTELIAYFAALRADRTAVPSFVTMIARARREVALERRRGGEAAIGQSPVRHPHPEATRHPHPEGDEIPTPGGDEGG